MISGFIIKKGKMSSVFLEDGRRIAVTRCSSLPLPVTQIKDKKKDGYNAVQLAYGNRQHIDKPTKSKLKKVKLNITPKGFIEFNFDPDNTPQLGASIAIDTVFSVDDMVNVQGISKGRGFAGVIKRHGFHRQPVTRGQSDRTRAPGSIGAQTPGKVIKGKKMPGHYGVSTHTVSNLKIISIDNSKNTIDISGSLPGHTNSWLIISSAKKNK